MNLFRDIDLISDRATYFSTHSHDFWEILCYIEGEGEVIAGNRRIPFRADSILIIPPGVSHEEHSGEGFRNYYISCRSFSGVPSGEVSSFQDTSGRTFLHIAALLHREYLLQQKNWQELCEAYLNVLQQYILCWTDFEYSSIINELKSLIVQNISNPDFTIREALHAFPISSDYLREQFREKTGILPSEYLSNLRIDYAKRLLLHGHIRIAEVARMAGYRDSLYFSRAFRKKTGLNPTDFRKQHC